MSTLPRTRGDFGSPNLNWLIPIGVLLLVGGIAALVNTANSDVVDWIKDNSSCNERPCTYDEAKTILLTLGVLATVAGAAMTIFALWRAVRTRDAGPVLPPPPAPEPVSANPAQPVEPATGEGEPGEATRFGFPEGPRSDAPADRLARLDELLAQGSLDFEEYSKRRQDILEQM